MSFFGFGNAHKHRNRRSNNGIVYVVFHVIQLDRKLSFFLSKIMWATYLFAFLLTCSLYFFARECEYSVTFEKCVFLDNWATCACTILTYLSIYIFLWQHFYRSISCNDICTYAPCLFRRGNSNMYNYFFSRSFFFLCSFLYVYKELK